ncbi:MAG: helix-turn-helix domain-containing protein [Streptosporangiaceae bacterium]|jgi:excisionase family DNA binding protein
MTKKMLSVEGTAEELGVSVRTVWDLIYRGDLDSVQIPSPTGRRKMRRIERAALDRFIEANRASAQTA